MKKILFFTFICSIAVNFFSSTQAFVRYEDKQPKIQRKVHATGFIDYAPFGAFEHIDNFGKFNSIFQIMLNDLSKPNNWRISYDVDKKSYQELVHDVRKGFTRDILLGAYDKTEMFRNLELLYPAAINNPVTVIMLPNRIKDIKSIADIKKLKGIRLEDEIYSDYVSEQIKQFNIETASTSYELFEKLFTKQVDYILISQYYGMIQAIKLGLYEQVAFLKQPLWQMPLFIAVSKFSKERKLISQKITRYLEIPENRKKFQDAIVKLISETQKNSAGIVPPTFGLENNIGPKEAEIMKNINK